jgi:hypothetical protein
MPLREGSPQPMQLRHPDKGDKDVSVANSPFSKRLQSTVPKGRHPNQSLADSGSARN